MTIPRLSASIVRATVLLLSLIVPTVAGAQGDHTTQVLWNADSTVAQIPSDHDCRMVGATFDTAVKTQGAASMKVIFGGQGAHGCQDFEPVTISNDWFNGEWICHNWSMKMGNDMDWSAGTPPSNQYKFKINRDADGPEGRMSTTYMHSDWISMDEPGGNALYNPCVGDYCFRIYYHFDFHDNANVL